MLNSFFILTFFSILLCGCAPVTLTIPYTPQSAEEINAKIKVNKFDYILKSSKILPNQINNTAAGSILLTENIDMLFTNAVQREFRQSGISLKNANCSLDGDIENFLLDDLGFSVTYITDIHYRLCNDNGIIFDKNVHVEFETTKFFSMEQIFASINKSIADNIGNLLKDRSFIDSVNQYCK
jgi:uncharacterized lipoprotein